MLRPASLRELPRYPITASISVAALGVTAAWWSGWDIGHVAMTERVWNRWELWRAPTSTLPHVNVFHLAFNLYWFWVFGTLVEKVFGHLKLACIVIILAFGSSLAEFALLGGGVGLSGVGYGLWAMLWVLERGDPRFRGAVDRYTTQTFVAWFFLCVILTVTNVMPIANIAHAVGAGLGVLLGLLAGSRGTAKLGPAAALVLVTGLCIASATVFWPWVNLTDRAELAVERSGIEALERNDVPRGIHLLEVAANTGKAPARAWFNLGTAYQRAHRLKDAARAYERAAQMPGADGEMKQAARDLKYWR